MASLDELREENKKTPPNKDVKDTCALVIRDHRRIQIEDKIDRIGVRKVEPSEPEDDEEEDFASRHRGGYGYGRACDVGASQNGGGGVKNPSLPFHLSLYGNVDDHTRNLLSRRVVVVDEAGRAYISRHCVSSGHMGAVCA